MVKKNQAKSRTARRTGSPVGSDEVRRADDSVEYEITEESYEVEAVVGHRMRRGGMEYKVRWRGWSEQFDEWLHHTKMDCPEAIQQYWDSLNHEKRDEKTPESQTTKRVHRSTSSHKAASRTNKVTSPSPKRTRRESEANSRRRPSTSEAGSRSRPSESEASTSADVNTTAPSVETTVEDTPKAQLTKNSEEDVPEEDVPKPSEVVNDVESQDTTQEPDSEVSDNAPLISLLSTTAANDRASPCTSVSSTRSVPPLIIKRKIPRPPALPKRKSVSSISALASAGSSSAPASPKLPMNRTASEIAEHGVSKQPEVSQPKPTTPPNKDGSPELGSQDKTEQSSSSLTKPDTAQKEPEPVVEKRFVRPHGFERGLSVERIHMFLKKADRIFAVVQFKNCDTLEVLATQIVQHYEPLALIRGFEELHIRCRQNAILADISSQPTES